MDISLSQVKVKIPVMDRPLFEITKFQIPSGSKVLIQGASGKGKTTLLHLIAGLFLPNEGSVHWDDIHLGNLNEEERAQFRKKNSAIVFQKLNLIDHLTALENVLLSLPQSKDQKEIALEALRKVHIEDKKDVMSTFLSLGEQQRVAVARVLAQRPKVILADEPTSSLDEKNAHDVMDALFRATENKGTLIVVSHDYRISQKFDRVIKFEDLVRS